MEEAKDVWNVRRMCWELKWGGGGGCAVRCGAVNWASVLECAGCMRIKTHEQEEEEGRGQEQLDESF